MTTARAPEDAASAEVADRQSEAGVGEDGGDHAGTVPFFTRTWAVVGGLTLAIAALPLAVALGVLRHPRWYPLLDLAQTELRVRDVGTRDTPLVGLAGRFNAFDQQGSHLGPISFWSLWPLYKLFGGTAWALQAAAASLNVIAAGVAIWIGKRRGGVQLALGVAAGLAVLLRVYGADKLTEAWNPYMPMLWWVVFLLAVWSVLCDDLPMLPVAVFAGTFCMQTHVPYVGMVGGIAALLVLVAAGWLVLRRADGDLGRRVVRWGGASLALLVALWIPPVVEQLTEDPGNMTIMRESLTHSEEDSVPLGDAVSVWLGHLNVGELVVPPETDVDPSDNALPGAVLLAVWVVAAVLTWRDRKVHDPALARLHALVGVALLLGLVSITRITGLLWYYLVLWSWGTTVLLLIAVIWTFWRRVFVVRNKHAPPEAERRGAIVLGVLAVVATVAFTYDAAHTEVPASTETALLAELAPPTVEALQTGDLPGGGESGRYLVLWDSDALGIGSQGFGMLLELERQGFDVGASGRHKTGVVEHRVLDPEDASAAVHYVVGEDEIQRWGDTPNATLVAEADVRTPEEQERFDELRAELTTELQATGHPDLVALLDQAMFLLAIHEDMPPELRPTLTELTELGVPAAVFVTPPDVLQPVEP